MRKEGEIKIYLTMPNEDTEAVLFKVKDALRKKGYSCRECDYTFALWVEAKED